MVYLTRVHTERIETTLFLTYTHKGLNDRKGTSGQVRPAKIQISLRFAAWSKSSLGAFLSCSKDAKFFQADSEDSDRLHGCAGWFAFSLDAHVRIYVFSHCSFQFVSPIKTGQHKVRCGYSLESPVIDICYGYYKQIYIFSTAKKPRYAKTCLQAYVDSEGPDQPAHPRSLIRAFTVRYQHHWTLQYVSTESQCPDETLRMHGMNLNLFIFAHAWRHLFGRRGPDVTYISIHLNALSYLFQHVSKSVWLPVDLSR